jgi:tRNA G10  N-methylase Trm11
MRYLFILGRNVELSTEEIKAFLEREKINFRIISKISNGILIETERILRGFIDRLGGTVSIGEVLTSGEFEKITGDLENKPLHNAKKNKLNYVIFNFNGKEYERIAFYLKNRFRKEGLKATEKKITGRISLQGGEEVSKVSSNLIDEQFFVFENNFGKIIEETDYEKIEKRDMGKPVRRNELSISPRLAKIMINLSQVREGQTLLDPFCGVGTILQEALLQKINVIGIDKDRKAIDCSELNLKWFNFSKNNYRLIKDDSARIKIPDIDAIATEPDLGELQKRMLTEEKAKEITGNFEKLIVDVLRNLKKNVKGRIVFTAPLILADKKRVSCNFDSISLQAGLKIAKGFPINEFRENSIVGRSVVVMENGNLQRVFHNSSNPTES